MNLITLRRVVAIMAEKCVPFIPDVGAHCPLCKEFFRSLVVGDPLPKTRIPDPTTRIRYHVCPRCALNFSSIEQIDVALVAVVKKLPRKCSKTRQKKTSRM